MYVDGAAGLITADPDDSQRAAAEHWAATASLLADFDGTGATADGHLVPLLANVGGAKDAVAAAKLNAQGVGLFRTEFCFLERDTEPTVDEQAAAYKGVFDAFPGKKVVLRTLDAGADKPLPFLTDATEPNPALGVRGYRTDFTTPGVLERQLQAIARAEQESGADVWVMAPMISTAEEAARFATLCAEAGSRPPGSWWKSRRRRSPPRRSSGRSGSRAWGRMTSPSTPWPPTASSARSLPSTRRGSRPSCGWWD